MIVDFHAPDEARFPALRLAREAMDTGGLSGAVLNGAKEAALEAFMAGRIGFLAMAAVVEETLAALAPAPEAASLDDVFAIDAESRRISNALVTRRAVGMSKATA